MKIGNIVQRFPCVFSGEEPDIGIIIEVIDCDHVPPVCRILWSSGNIEKEWTDDVEVL